MAHPDNIREEQLRLLHQQIPRGQVLNLLLAVIFATAAWFQNRAPGAWMWLTLFVVISALRLTLHYTVVPPAGGRRITRRSHLVYALTAMLSGSAWGVSVYVLEPGSLAETVLIALTLAGVMAGAISVLSYLLLSYLAFAVPIAVALAHHFLTGGHEATSIIGLMVLVYLLGCLYFSRVFNGVVVRTLLLRHENEALLRDLKRQKEVAEDANIAKSKFLAAASHDLRQPLHALALLIDAVKAARSEQERAAIYPRVEQSLEALSSLFNALLDISKLDAAAVKPQTVDFPLQPILQGLIGDFEDEVGRKGLTLRMRNCAVAVHSDPVLLARVLRNLISNAVRYTEMGGVLVACRRRHGGVVVQVWDTGIGIPRDKRDEVFQEFHQINNPHRDRSQGLGLGLAIVRRMCDLLGHTIELHSRLGRGTVVSVRLPASRDPGTSGHPSPERAPGWDMSGRRVLVIDDESDVLQATGLLLDQWGCETLTAQSGEEALARVQTFGVAPDVIISDLRLRNEETGIEAIRTVCTALGQQIPAVLLTGDTAPERIRLARDSGYVLLHKPLQPARLRSALFHAMRQSGPG